MARGVVAGTALAALAIGAALAVPNLIEARKNGNEAAAIGALKTFATSEASFREGEKERDGNLDYGMLSELNNTRLIDTVFGSDTKPGYLFKDVSRFSTSEFLWFSVANPAIAGTTGDRYFTSNMLPPASVPIEVPPARRLATTDDLRPRPPALLARPDGPELRALPLEALRISAVLGATRARILVDCAFRNPFPRELEGTLLVSLPEGASPCYLGTFQGDGGDVKDVAALVSPWSDAALLLEPGFAPRASWSTPAATVEWGALRPAHVVEEKKGKVVYEHVTRRRVDPALMEWSGGNRFSTRIYPIAAGARKRVVFAFDQAPREVSGTTLLSLPVPSPLPASSRVDVAVRGPFTDPRLVHGEVETPLEDGQAAVTPVPGDEGSFVLAATPRSGRARAGFSAKSALPGSLVHARLSPAAPSRGDRPTGDAVFLLDTSLSQRTRLAASCGRLLRSVLERDGTIGRFRVVSFDVSARELTEGWCSNTPAERERVLDLVEHVWLEGATNLDVALARLETLIAPSEHPTVFLLSDAEVTWGQDDPRELERAHARIFGERWIAYQIGDAPVNRPVVERLTRSGGRVVASVDAEGAALAHRTLPLRLEAVRVEGVPSSDLIVAGAPRTIFPGQALEVAFRVPAGCDPRKAEIVLETEAGPQSFGLGEAVEDALAGRAWAELVASSLLELSDEAADEVVLALSQRFALANRVASFIILERDAEYRLHEIDGKAIDLEAVVRAAGTRAARRPVGEPDTSALPPEARAFLDAIRGRQAKPWQRAAVPVEPASFERPSWPPVLEPVAVHREATRRRSAGRADEALRVLSSLVEESPRDERALRLVGFALFSWGFHEEASSLFARTRTLRPFEPQAWLCEALALEARGLVAEAALRYEIVLAGRFDPRHDDHAKLSARTLYTRLLSTLGRRGAARAREISDEAPPRPAFESVLFWSLDDAALDLHAIERDGRAVDDRNPESTSGGLVEGDTAGLGPRIYSHPLRAPREVSVRSSGAPRVAGSVPVGTLLVVLERGRNPVVTSAVLTGRDEILWSDRGSGYASGDVGAALAFLGAVAGLALRAVRAGVA